MAYKDEKDLNYSKICLTCGKVFYKHKCLSYKEWETRKFCCWSCRRPIATGKEIIRHEKFDPTIHIKECLYCGKRLNIPDIYNFKKRKYCSKNCAKLAKYNINSYILIKKEIDYKKLTADLLKNCEIYSQPRGVDSPFWLGGIKGHAIYKTYAHQIDWIDDIRHDPDNNDLLQVRCTNCNKWFNPTRGQVFSRSRALKDDAGKESRFYCSDECKNSCSIFYQQKYPKGNKPYYSREVQPELAAMVLERDGYECQRCGNKSNLQCHHYEGIEQNPIESADIDICVTLCKQCHKKAHKDVGCRRIDLRKDSLCNNLLDRRNKVA